MSFKENQRGWILEKVDTYPFIWCDWIFRSQYINSMGALWKEDIGYINPVFRFSQMNFLSASCSAVESK